VRNVSIENLKSGMVLGRSLYSGPNKLALAAGQTLDTAFIQLLKEHGYKYAVIEQEGFETIKPQDVLSDTSRRLAESAMSESVERLQHAIKLKTVSGEITKELLQNDPDLFNVPNADDMTRAVSSIVRDIIDRNIGLVDVFAQVAQTTYLYRHGVNVSALSVLIGRQFGYSSKQLRELALAALLHDFGKVCLGNFIKRPKHDLSDEEQERFKEHPTFGAILVKNTDPELVAEQLAIWHHHEWQNGEGYPQALTGENLSPSRTTENFTEGIHPYGEIIAVAESFDNFVNGNGELPRPLDPAEALGTIMSFSHKKFNTAVCHAFSQIVCLYPTGSMVQIQRSTSFGLEGYYGVVQEQGEHPAKPILILYADPDGNRVKPKIMDFTKDKDLLLKLMV